MKRGTKMKKILSFCLSLCMILSLCPILLVSAQAKNAVYYVAYGGTGDGLSHESPLGSLGAAISAINAAGLTTGDTATVYISSRLYGVAGKTVQPTAWTSESDSLFVGFDSITETHKATVVFTSDPQNDGYDASDYNTLTKVAIRNVYNNNSGNLSTRGPSVYRDLVILDSWANASYSKDVCLSGNDGVLSNVTFMGLDNSGNFMKKKLSLYQGSNRSSGSFGGGGNTVVENADDVHALFVGSLGHAEGHDLTFTNNVAIHLNAGTLSHLGFSLAYNGMSNTFKKNVSIVLSGGAKIEKVATGDASSYAYTEPLIDGALQYVLNSGSEIGENTLPAPKTSGGLSTPIYTVSVKSADVTLDVTDKAGVFAVSGGKTAYVQSDDCTEIYYGEELLSLPTAGEYAVLSAADRAEILQNAQAPDSDGYSEFEGWEDDGNGTIRARFAVNMPVYFLSESGDDTNDGLSADTPFKTFKAVCAKAQSEDVAVNILGAFTLNVSDKASHDGNITIMGYDENASIASQSGNGIGFGGPVTLRNITYKRGTNAYIVTAGKDITFGEEFKTTASSDWFVFGGTQGSASVSGSTVTVKDGNFGGSFVIGSMMPPSAGGHITSDSALHVLGGSIGTVTLGSSYWGSCGATIFDKNLFLEVSGGTVGTIKALGSATGRATSVGGTLEILLNDGAATVLDDTLSEISCGKRYFVRSGKGGKVAPVYDESGALVPGKIHITIDKEGDYATVVNGTERSYYNVETEITLSEGTTEITYGEKQLEKGTTVPMTWKPMDKGYITLIFDDNNAELPFFYNVIAKEYGLPMCAAVPSKTLATNNAVLHDIQNRGGEILSHTRDHIVLNRSVDWETVDYQLGQSYRELTADGFNVHGIILAGGQGQDQTEDYRRDIEGFTNKYYLYSDKYGASTQYWKQRNWFDGRTVEELKQIIDEQIENKTWEVIYAHNTKECSEETLRAVLDYLVEKRDAGLVDVVTYRYVHETFGDWESPVDFGDTTYTVEFYGSDKNEYLGKSVVVKGASAVLPEGLILDEGYTLTGWSESLENITGNKKVYALCADKDGKTVDVSLPSVIHTQKIFYLDSTNGSDENSGLSKENAFKTINAAVAAANGADFSVCVIGTFSMPANVSSHAGRMTLYGADTSSVLAIPQSWGVYLGGPCTIRDITFKNGLYAYVYTNGADLALGDGITTSGNHQIISGSYAGNVTESSSVTVSSGSYSQIYLGEIAVSTVHTIPGDLKAHVTGGKITELKLGNHGWLGTHVGTVYNGNILVRVDGGTVEKVMVTTGNYAVTFNGAVEMIFNNGTDTAFQSTFTDSSAKNGKYIVKSAVGGSVDFVYNEDGTRAVGKYFVNVPEGMSAKITNGENAFYLLTSGEITLAPGTAAVSYEKLSETDHVIKVVDGESTYYYGVADKVNLTHGGTIVFPEENASENSVFCGWYADAEFTKPILQNSAIEAGTIYARRLPLSERDLYLEGVQVRTSGNLGLRYISNITHALRTTLVGLNERNAPLSPENDAFNETDGISYGTILLPENYLAENELIKNGVYTVGEKNYYAKTVPAKKTFETVDEFDRYTAVLIGISEENLARRYTARAYITYCDASGIERTVYGNPYGTSLYTVAERIYEDGAKDEPEEKREEILAFLLKNILSKVDGTQNPLANTVRALKNDKKLTVGYLGGSITNGYTAAYNVKDDGTVENTGGNILLSYVNRTTDWLEKAFPDATIESVNAGVSDTATNLGVYRLAPQLMNEDGHDMPDLVFVEFTSNDWIYDDCITQSRKDIRRQIESLVLNIYEKNPYADIVFVFTARSENASSRPVYVEVAEKYGIPTVDMGIALQKLMTARGAANESKGNYYYTVDNLHPSALGYGVYFEEIEKTLTPYLTSAVYYEGKCDHTKALPEASSRSLWRSPTILPASSFTVTGNAAKGGGLNVTLFGTSKTASKNIAFTPDSLTITEEGTKVAFDFTGTTLALPFFMTSSGINMEYTIDGKDVKNLTVDTDFLSFQRYAHTQLFVLEQELAYGTHAVELTFRSTSDGKVNVRLGGACVAGEDNHLDKLIALSIDDGPRVESSNAILDVLQKFGAHATFFSVGSSVNASVYPVMKRMVEQDCEIGNHGYGWNSMANMTEEELKTDFNNTQNRIYAAAGVYPKVFRAPGLSVSDTMHETIPLPIFRGSLGISDWEESVSVEERIAALRANIVDGRIILIHDLTKNAEALDVVLPEMIEQGYTVVTISELASLRGYKPKAHAGVQYGSFEK